MRTLKKPLTRTAIAGLLAMSLTGLAACGEDTPEADAGVETSAEPSDDPSVASGDDEVDVESVQEEGPGTDDVYDGSYDDPFRDDVTSFEGDRVTVSAEVSEIVSEKAFSIGGIDDPDVAPLLVIHEDPMSWLEAGMPVTVTGVVHKAYDVAIAEDQLDTQLDEVTFEAWGQEPYIEADTVGELSSEK